MEQDNYQNANDTNISPIDFTPVSVESFFDGESIEEAIKPGIIVFTEHQQYLVNKLVVALDKYNSDKLDALQKRLSYIEQLADAIANFPSLLERVNLTSSVRTPETLIENLISYSYPEDGDTTLHLPSKATLGKGFLVAKIHTFFSMSKLAKNFANMDEKEVQEYDDETVSIMFTLMAEDVYLNLIRDKSLPIAMRKDLAQSLIILWEHRADATMADIAPVLQSVWLARRKLAPAFGTMMGTSELLMVSFQLDEQWTRFIKQNLSNPEVAQAMEEFLFGLSYEQISKLKAILREQGVKAIGRDEVSAYLNERVKTDVSLDYRDFYLLYTVRRDNARSRQRLRIPGPKKTLEDFFFCFVMEQNQSQ